MSEAILREAATHVAIALDVDEREALGEVLLSPGRAIAVGAVSLVRRAQKT